MDAEEMNSCRLFPPDYSRNPPRFFVPAQDRAIASERNDRVLGRSLDDAVQERDLFFNANRLIQQDVVHARRQQQQTDQMRLAGVGKLAKAQVVEQVIGQPDLLRLPSNWRKLRKPKNCSIDVYARPGSRKLILTTVTGGLR
jgi:hypothetical protein